jgi:glycogen(starch) synthase
LKNPVIKGSLAPNAAFIHRSWKMAKKVIKRIAYLSGPVDAADIHRKWITGAKPHYFGDSHVAQFFELCARENYFGYVITTLPSVENIYRSDNIVIENCAPPKTRRGLLFHLNLYMWLIALLPKIILNRPDILLITAGSGHGIVTIPLIFFRIAIIPVLTCTLWPKFKRLKASQKSILFFSKFFFRYFAASAVAASEDIAQQLRMITVNRLEVAVFLPLYSPIQFDGIKPAKLDENEVHLFFAGRIETNKGVFDLVEIANRLEQLKPKTFRFHICGEGTQIHRLRADVDSLMLSEVVLIHGFCARQKICEIMSMSSIVIVPTTIDFEEGFNMVCAEAILSERPLITSAVCPAIRYVRNATIEVRPGNIEDYSEAILRLAQDGDLYRQKRAFARQLQAQFYDASNSWGEKVREAIAAV